MADVAAQAVLMMQSSAPEGLTSRLTRLAGWPRSWRRGGEFQYVVHPASGMVAAQLGISVGRALIRMRADAFGNDRSLTAVAEDVVARALRFDLGSGEKNPIRSGVGGGGASGWPVPAAA